jgi:hypothetical protein
MSQKTANFFISYNSKDIKMAEWVVWELEAAGYNVIIQTWDFQPGNNFVLEMQKASSNAEVTLALLSENYLRALYTQPEWAAAFASDPTGDKRKLIPIRIEDIPLHGLLPQIIYVDLVDKDAEEAKLALLAGVSIERAKPISPPSFPGRVKRKETDVTDILTVTNNWEQNWLNNRIENLKDNKQPVKLPDGGMLAVHMIPIEAISSSKTYPINMFEKHTLTLKPIFCMGWDHKINKEGFYTYSKWQGEVIRGYTQIFRNGIIEATDAGLLYSDKVIPGALLEREIITHVNKYLNVHKDFDAKLPIAISINLLNIKNYNLGTNTRLKTDPIQDDILSLPISYITSWDVEIDRLLRPSFDYMYNNFGLAKSPNYDVDGKWKEVRNGY